MQLLRETLALISMSQPYSLLTDQTTSGSNYLAKRNKPSELGLGHATRHSAPRAASRGEGILFIPNWERITDDHWVLSSSIQGYKLEFLSTIQDKHNLTWVPRRMALSQTR